MINDTELRDLVITLAALECGVIPPTSETGSVDAGLAQLSPAEQHAVKRKYRKLKRKIKKGNEFMYSAYKREGRLNSFINRHLLLVGEEMTRG